MTSDRHETARKRHQQLSQQLHDHNYRYHTLDQPTISDAEYDQLMQQLLKIEEQYPELVTPDSPSQRVGSVPLQKYSQVQHKIPMLSLKNAQNDAHILEFLQKIKNKIIELRNTDSHIELIAEPKVDGLSCSLRYENRKLVLAATRGDGNIGEDVTKNIAAVTDIPRSLPEAAPEAIEVRGEIYISDQDFIKINKTQEQQGKKLFSNPRNAAAGYLKQLDLNSSKEQPLKFFGYALGENSIDSIRTQTEIRENLSSWGFALNEPSKIVSSIDEISIFQKHIEKERSTLGYSIDGVVYKINDLSLQQRMGNAGKYPNWAIAYKFPAEKAHTHIKEIFISVGRLGALTPVAILEPVSIGGVWVSRATLHNEDEIKRKDFRVEDLVVVQRAGDVIPQVISVELTDRPRSSTPFQYPTKCPSCGGEIDRNEAEAAWVCNAGAACPAQALERLKFFVSRKAFYIKELGSKNIEYFYNEGLIKKAADIFKLKKKLEPKTLYNHESSEIVPLQNRMGWGEVSSHKLFSAIDERRNIPLSKFIFSLGINSIGETISKKIAKQYRSFENLRRSIDAAINGDQEEAITIRDICGKVASENLLSFFKNKENTSDINELLREVSVQEENSTNKDGILSGKLVVFTGKLSMMTRDEAKTRAEELGAIIGNSITQKTNLVVAGKSAGSKLKKAEKYGIQIISEEQWKELTNG